MDHEYLVMKLGNIKGIDFLEEHQKVIKKYGYVDFARTGKRRIDFSCLNEPYFFIKESLSGGNRIIRAYIDKDSAGDKKTPDYYANLNLSNASWVRINRLETIDRSGFLIEYTLKNGNKIKALDNGAVSYFYIIKSKKE